MVQNQPEALWLDPVSLATEPRPNNNEAGKCSKGPQRPMACVTVTVTAPHRVSDSDGVSAHTAGDGRARVPGADCRRGGGGLAAAGGPAPQIQDQLVNFSSVGDPGGSLAGSDGRDRGLSGATDRRIMIRVAGQTAWPRPAGARSPAGAAAEGRGPGQTH